MPTGANKRVPPCFFYLFLPGPPGKFTHSKDKTKFRISPAVAALGDRYYNFACAAALAYSPLAAVYLRRSPAHHHYRSRGTFRLLRLRLLYILLTCTNTSSPHECSLPGRPAVSLNDAVPDVRAGLQHVFVRGTGLVCAWRSPKEG